MKNNKVGFILIFSLVIFTFLFFEFQQYKNLRDRFNNEIFGVVTKIDRGRNRLFYILDDKKERVYLYCVDEDLIQIGDSIVKKNNSVEVLIYNKLDNNFKYRSSIFFEKSQPYYNFIIK